MVLYLGLKLCVGGGGLRATALQGLKCRRWPVVPWILLYLSFLEGAAHRLTMELDIQSLFGLHSLHWLRPRKSPPSSRIWAQIRGRYWSAKVVDISL
jgi:hypothetical protein